MQRHRTRCRITAPSVHVTALSSGAVLTLRHSCCRLWPQVVAVYVWDRCMRRMFLHVESGVASLEASAASSRGRNPAQRSFKGEIASPLASPRSSTSDE